MAVCMDDATEEERYNAVYIEAKDNLNDLTVFCDQTRPFFMPSVLHRLDFEAFKTKKDLTSNEFKEAVAVAACTARTEARAAVRQAQLRAIAGNPKNKDFERLTSTQKAKVLHATGLLNETKGAFEASLYIMYQLQGKDFQPGEVTEAFTQVVDEMDL